MQTSYNLPFHYSFSVTQHSENKNDSIRPSDAAWVFFAAQAKPTSMRRAVAERLAKTGHVVIVDQPISLLRDRRMPSFKERCAPLSEDSTSYHYSPLHFPEGFPPTRRLVKTLNRLLMKGELDRLLPHKGPRIVCYDSPSQYTLAKRLGERVSLYLAIDDRTLTVTGQLIKGELEAEQKLLDKVDSVVCVSQPLADTLESRAPRGRTLPIHVLPNGYDERVFNSEADYNEPEFLRHIPRPRLLVAGHVSERIDWPGIAEASRLRTQWSWVFVGPADTGMPETIPDILGKRGFWHPQIALAEVPAWISHSDVCSVPYRLNDFTCASSPLKAIEYLAMGAPVLSTRVPSLRCYNDAIRWVNEGDGSSYAEALDELADEKVNWKSREARRAVVRNDSWEERSSQFKNIILSQSTRL